jgi:hypothetical protein
MKKPTVILEPDGLGMSMPDKDITVTRISELVGKDRIVDCLQVATQTDLQMTVDANNSRWRNGQRTLKLRHQSVTNC